MHFGHSQALMQNTVQFIWIQTCMENYNPCGMGQITVGFKNTAICDSQP